MGFIPLDRGEDHLLTEIRMGDNGSDPSFLFRAEEHDGQGTMANHLFRYAAH